MSVLLLDTSVAIPLRDADATIEGKFRAVQDRTVLMSIVTRVELEGGVHQQAEHAAVRRARLDLLLAALPVLNFGPREAEAYGRIVAVLRYSRRKLLDRMIASQALVADATLVTLNGEDFRDVPGLKLLEW